jgi:hypothetical protein
MSELTREERLRRKAKEVIDLLKEYLPEYKETFDLYDPDKDYNLLINAECYEAIMGEFICMLNDKDDTYALYIGNTLITKTFLSNPFKPIEIVRFVDKEKLKTYTWENPWTWDDAIEVINKKIKERKEYENK